ncbi:MAG: HlyC/CorC family transporter [Planctomycetales bacterium]|nr:HlyC/CorC family transporter [Planctomycetales bacterium]
MNAGALLSMAIGGWLAAGFTAIGAKVLRDFSRAELEEYSRRQRNARRMDEILDHYEEVSVAAETLQVVAMVTFVVAGYSWWQSLVHRFAASETILAEEFVGAVTAAVFLLLVTTVWLPWAVVQFGSAAFLYHTWRIWRAIAWALWPFSLCARLAEAFMQRLTGSLDDEQSEEEAFEEEIRAIVTEGLREGHLEADAREMIEAVIELGDIDVADVMTPRSSVDALDVDSTWQEIVDLVGECGRTRIPVYEGSLDRVIGILYAKDLLPVLVRSEGTPPQTLRQLLREPWFVPTSKKVDDLLRDFLRTHNHMAVVRDEYDAVAGVVTIEDTLEEIVGEIADEYDDDEEEQIRDIDEHSAEVLGGTHVEDVNEHFGIDLDDEDDFDTLAGLVLSKLGRIPRRDECLEIGPVRIIVLDATRRKIEKLKVEVVDRSRTEA